MLLLRFKSRMFNITSYSIIIIGLFCASACVYWITKYTTKSASSWWCEREQKRQSVNVLCEATQTRKVCVIIFHVQHSLHSFLLCFFGNSFFFFSFFVILLERNEKIVPIFHNFFVSFGLAGLNGTELLMVVIMEHLCSVTFVMSWRKGSKVEQSLKEIEKVCG